MSPGAHRQPKAARPQLCGHPDLGSVELRARNLRVQKVWLKTALEGNKEDALAGSQVTKSCPEALKAHRQKEIKVSTHSQTAAV